MGGASEWQGGQLPLVLYVLLPAAPSRRERKNICALSTLSIHCRSVKFYAKIQEMCQNTAQSMLNFFLFPVVNGQSTCC